MAHSSFRPEQPTHPPLRSLEVALTVARCGSLTAAASAIGMTHGAVSRHVKTVEDWVKLSLFDRHGRGMALTQEGRIFFTQVEKGFAVIDQAADRWQRRRGRDVVRISTTPTFAKLWLLPRLNRIESQEPAIHVDLNAEAGFADVQSGDIDLAIRYTRPENLPDNAELLMPERVFPVASPEIAAEIAEGDVESLLGFALLHDTDAAKWRAWFNGVSGRSFRPRARDRRFSDYPLCLAAAEAGLGIALVQCPLIDENLKGLNLVRLAFSAADSPQGYYVLTPPGSPRPGTLRLLERLEDEVAACPLPGS